MTNTTEKIITSETRSELAGDCTGLDEFSMMRLMQLLCDACGIDFSYYRSGTVARRIERRRVFKQAADFDSYVESAANDAEELNVLYQDLLITVTEFFRDPMAFRRLERDVLPELLKGRSRGDEVRMWVPGCTTGEEPYSLAMLLVELMEKWSLPLSVKIFATDVHREALNHASKGVYSEASLARVSPKRLRRFFMKNGDQYYVIPELRQMIVFAPHDIIRDVPFTRLDLISCRNLLIHLQPPIQPKAISLFHFGLRTGGVLFLGSCESVGALREEFDTVDKYWRIYRKRRGVRLPLDKRLPLTPVAVVNRSCIT